MRTSSVEPDDVMHEEDTPLYLASAFSPEAAAGERGYLLEEVVVSEEWYEPRALTAGEMADDDYQSWLNPDFYPEDDCSRVEVEYLQRAPGAPGAHKYLRVTAKEATDA
jgi:hypothetical protein